MSDTFLRYLLLLQEMPHSPRMTDSAGFARLLEQRGFRVSRRTVQRDLEKLSRVLPIVCSDGTKPYGWSWRPGASSPLPARAASLGRPRPADPGTLLEAVLASLDRSRELCDGRFEAGLLPFIEPHLADAVAAHTGLLLSETVIALPPSQRRAGSGGFEVSFVLSSVYEDTAVLVRVCARGKHEHTDPELEARALSALGRPGARLRVLFVEPAPAPGRNDIGFADLAVVVERRSDAQSRCLARYLRRWAVLAGAPRSDGPRDQIADVIPLAARPKQASR